MNEKIVVPDGMLESFVEKYREQYGCRPHSVHEQKIVLSLEAALRWLDGELEKMLNEKPPEYSIRYREAVSDVRRMFRAPETEIPECHAEVFSDKFGAKKAVVCSCGFAITYTVMVNNADALGMKFFQKRHAAFKLGQQSGARK